MSETTNHRQVTQRRSRYFPPVIDPRTVDFVRFAEEYEAVQSEMDNQGTWFEDGQNYGFRRAASRDIALGRFQYYVQFADFLYERYGKRFYLLDFMTRPRNEHRGSGLLYFIETAAEIHVNLEGVSARELAQATVGIGRKAVDCGEVQAPFATAWEINQIFHGGLLGHTIFHTGSRLSRFQVYWSMRGKVPMGKILNDNRHLIAEAARAEAGLEELTGE